MAIKLNSKIVSYRVKAEENKADEETPASLASPSSETSDSPDSNQAASKQENLKQAEPKQADSSSESQQLDLAGDKHKGATIVRMHEKVERPETLIGSTYKIKTPVSEHAFYITINDIVLNPDTPYEKRRPFEIFINSKNMDHYQWISALTLIISAVFRKGGDVTFLVKELRSVFDPKGGYFKRGGKYVPSLVAEIGDAIESHMKYIGMIKDDSLDEHQQKLIDEKRKEYEDKLKAQTQKNAKESDEDNNFPAGASLCSKCSTKAMIMMDGCLTCLNCGDSKCG